MNARHPKAAAAAESAKCCKPNINMSLCKELLKSEFWKDDEDWVWKNATKKDDKVLYS